MRAHRPRWRAKKVLVGISEIAKLLRQQQT